jgi:hypothetical protein
VGPTLIIVRFIMLEIGNPWVTIDQMVSILMKLGPVAARYSTVAGIGMSDQSLG